MENKEYGIGYVEITTQEYKDLITEAVTSHKDAERYLFEKYKVESENEALRKENARLKERIAELERDYIYSDMMEVGDNG